MTRLEKIDVWRAFFNDYRDLSKGLLLKVGSEPSGYSNMASDFEVINKLHLDLANEKIDQLQSENTHLKEQIKIAKEALDKLLLAKNTVTNKTWKFHDADDWYLAKDIIKATLSQLTDKREKEGLE